MRRAGGAAVVGLVALRTERQAVYAASEDVEDATGPKTLGTIFELPVTPPAECTAVQELAPIDDVACLAGQVASTFSPGAGNPVHRIGRPGR